MGRWEVPQNRLWKWLFSQTASVVYITPASGLPPSLSWAVGVFRGKGGRRPLSRSFDTAFYVYFPFYARFLWLIGVLIFDFYRFQLIIINRFKNWSFKNLFVPIRETTMIHIWAKFHDIWTKTVASSVLTEWQNDRMTDTKIFYCKFLFPEVQNICKKILSLIPRKSSRNTLPHNTSFGTTDI